MAFLICYIIDMVQLKYSFTLFQEIYIISDTCYVLKC